MKAKGLKKDNKVTKDKKDKKSPLAALWKPKKVMKGGKDDKGDKVHTKVMVMGSTEIGLTYKQMRLNLISC